MNAQVHPARRAPPEKQWWLRTLAVFQSPSAVFAAMRDDSDEQADARQEPVVVLVFLVALSVVLVSPSAGTLLDYGPVDGIFVARDTWFVIAFLVLAAGLAGLATYWIGGALLHVGLRGAGGRGSFRRSRHLLAFAAAPLALSVLVVWPVRLAVYGGDSFRTGGGDEGIAGWVFAGASAAFAVWSLALLVFGISVVQGWRLLRAAVSLALTLLAVSLAAVFVLIPLATG